MKQNTQEKGLTPLQKLRTEKIHYRRLSIQYEETLAADFQYIQENAGSILLSGISSLLFPGTKSSGKAKEEHSTPKTVKHSFSEMGFSDYLSFAGEMLPIAWKIIQPMVLTWGIKQTQKWFANKLFKKKK